jgi:hypothetical protein
VSGGRFEYIQHDLERVADEIEVSANNEFEYSNETHNRFLEAVILLRRAAISVNRIDWLLSGDDGEETFHKRLCADLDKLRGPTQYCLDDEYWSNRKDREW